MAHARVKEEAVKFLVKYRRYIGIYREVSEIDLDISEIYPKTSNCRDLLVDDLMA